MDEKTTNQTHEILVEKLGPAGTKQNLHILDEIERDLRSDEERLKDKSERSFILAALLLKAPLIKEDLKADFGPEDGSSYFLMPSNACYGRIRCKAGMLVVKKNQARENSLVEFTCSATSTAEAREMFLEALLPFLDYLCYKADCPVVVATVKIEDAKNNLKTIEYISPYRDVTINPHYSEFLDEMAPVYALYREAKNSNSDFYKFLCHYKILEGLLGRLRAEVYQRAKNKGVKLPNLTETVPDSEYIEAPQHKGYAGKSIKSFFDNVMTNQFRNEVAHFVTDEGLILDMSSPAHIDKYLGILYICEQCVRIVIKNHERLLSCLSSSSLSGTSANGQKPPLEEKQRIAER